MPVGDAAKTREIWGGCYLQAAGIGPGMKGDGYLAYDAGRRVAGPPVLALVVWAAHVCLRAACVAWAVLAHPFSKARRRWYEARGFVASAG